MCESFRRSTAFGGAARAIAAALLLGALPGAAAAEPRARLLMFDASWCEWCEAWEAEIGVSYHKTEEGARAPLVRIGIAEDLPEDVSLDRPARFTPTFVLLSDGAEIGRIEGYAGAHFFYPMLNALLDRLPDRTDGQLPEEDPDASL